jgi:hypothetical protein
MSSPLAVYPREIVFNWPRSYPPIPPMDRYGELPLARAIPSKAYPVPTDRAPMLVAAALVMPFVEQVFLMGSMCFQFHSTFQVHFRNSNLNQHRDHEWNQYSKPSPQSPLP